MPLNQVQIGELRQKLEEAWSQVVSEIHKTMGLGASFHGDWVDRAANLESLEEELDIGEMERQRLLQIEEALTRMDTGEYGTCQKCGKDIPLERLQAVPEASFDAKCKAEMESTPEI